MKFAFEVPLKHVEEFSPYQDYCYCFSHLLEKDRNGEYKKWVRRMKKRRETVFLDNGANENGVPSSKRLLFELVKDIRADIVVAPDKVSNHRETMELVRKFYSSRPSNFEARILVPFQGVRDEIMDLFTVIEDGDIIGFPIGRVASVNDEMLLMGNYLIDAEMMRFTIMKDTYKKYGEYLQERQIQGHLLGLKNPYMLKTYGYYNRFLESLDTTFVSIISREGIQLNDKKDYCFPWGTITTDFDFNWKFNESEKERVKENICVIKEMYEEGQVRYDNKQYEENIKIRNL